MCVVLDKSYEVDGALLLVLLYMYKQCHIDVIILGVWFEENFRPLNWKQEWFETFNHGFLSICSSLI